MGPDLEVAAAYALVGAALFYLSARAVVTRWLWSRYPAWLDGLMSCASCSGFWFAIGLHAAVRWPFLGVTWYWSWPLIALAAVIWTPLVAALHLRAMEYLGVPAPVDTEAPVWREIS